MQFTLADPTNPSATPSEILQKLTLMATVSPGPEGEDTHDSSRTNSIGPNGDDDDDDNDLDTSDETEEPGKLDVTGKKTKNLRLKRLRKKSKARAYEFTGGTDVVGIVFIEICRITDLPPERNSNAYLFAKKNHG